MSGLRAGSLSGKAMTKFITEMAAAIFRHKNYPTKEEKEHVAIRCIQKYPFLESSCGNGFVSGLNIILFADLLNIHRLYLHFQTSHESVSL